MDMQKEHKEFFNELDGRGFIFKNKTWLGGCFEADQLQVVWEMWQARVPDGYKLAKKSQIIGNPDVDWSQAPEWAKYWLKDGYSDKFWWSKSRPVKDMDLGCFVWGSGYTAEEAPSFGFSGSWDKSLTSKKAMIEAQEPSHD